MIRPKSPQKDLFLLPAEEATPVRQTLLRSAILATVFAAVAAAAAVLAENVDPDANGHQYAWGENVGWINAEPSATGNPGVHVTGALVTGYMWGENIGWINMNCTNNNTCGTTGNYGVKNDGAGNLSGYAWGDNVGWISFSCQNNPGTCASTGNYGVDIDPATGDWSGHAWGENIGWINFQHNQTANRIRTDDGDGIAGAGDNCPFDNNAAQTNTDSSNTGIGFPGSDAQGDACDVDDDGDGCSDAEEAVSSTGAQVLGGIRNGLDVWDFFDVTNNKTIGLDDTLLVLAHFGHGPNDDAVDNRVDRWVPNPGTFPWQSAEATGSNQGPTLQDALANLNQFGHDCTAAP
jgi:hypothetical protein